MLCHAMQEASQLRDYVLVLSSLLCALTFNDLCSIQRIPLGSANVSNVALTPLLRCLRGSPDAHACHAGLGRQ